MKNIFTLLKLLVRDGIGDRSEKMRSDFGDFYDNVLALFFKFDPAGVNYETNTDEYSSEVASLLPRMSKCKSEEDLKRLVLSTLTDYFEIGIDKVKTDQLVNELWSLWMQRRT